MERVSGSTGGATGSSTQVGEATEQAKQQTQQLASQARQQASELASRGTEQAKSQLANQKHNASQRLTPIQSALRESAQQLRNQGQGQVGDYAEKAADQVERFSSYLRQTDVDEIAEEVRGFARRRPGLFLGSAAAVGFLATRFLKSTSEEASSSSAGYGDSAPTTTGRTAVSYGADDTATALPPGSVEGSPTATRTPLANQAPTAGQPPVGTDSTEEPPTTSGGSDAR
jgi:hypothetical protein